MSALLSGTYPSPLFLVTSNTVKRKVYPRLVAQLPPHRVYILPDGEQAKSLEHVNSLWEWLAKLGADRQSVLVALGGGAVGDVAGFAAATYMRGIPWVAIPTTLLAMADAAHGGKTAINLGHAKNQVGAFHAPAEIIIKPELLDTLPYAELLSGWAEVLKHSLLHSQAAWREFRVAECDNAAVWPAALALSQDVKGAIVAQDPTEQGLRRALNLGHTLGHALESYFLAQGNPILHGQGVALGLLAEAYMAHKQKVCSPELLAQIEETILSQFPLLPIERSDIPALVRLLRQDKKRTAGMHRYVALAAPGQYNYSATFTDAQARSAFAILV